MRLLLLLLILILQLNPQPLFAEEIKSDKLTILWPNRLDVNDEHGDIMAALTLKFNLLEVDMVMLMDMGLRDDRTCQGQFKARALFQVIFAKGLKELKVRINPPCNNIGEARIKLIVRSKGQLYFNNFNFDVDYNNRCTLALPRQWN